MPDDARSIAFNNTAPAAERFDAQAQLTQTYAPTASVMIAPSHIMEVYNHISAAMDEASQMAKASIPYPTLGQKRPANGVQSVLLDELQTNVLGDYFDKPAELNFAACRDLVLRTPLLSAIVQTRIRQVSRFCQPSEDGGLGFEIRHVDRREKLAGDDLELAKGLTQFFKNCGWESNPRMRKKLKRDNYTQFMAKQTFDTLSMDSMPIETVMRRGRGEGIDSFYAIDGSTIRLCTDHGFQNDEEIFALQVIDGRTTTSYTHDELIYEVRNPRSDVRLAGYGLAEPEMMVRVITGWLNAMTYNTQGFDSNAIPKGMLHIHGNYSPEDIVAFKRQWNMMVKGVNNSWALPLMISKDQESKASFERFGVDFNEMAFSKWMGFLTSVACAIYAIAPEEINFESFSAGTSSLNGDDTETKLTQSKDKGFRPLMSFHEATQTDFIVGEFSDHLCFRYVGLDDEDPKQKWEEDKIALTWGELRARRGDPPLADPTLETLPLNAAFIAPWTAMQQAAQQPQDGEQGPDYGDDGDAPPGEFGAGDGEGEGGEADTDDTDDTAGAADAGASIQEEPDDNGGGGEGGDFGKALIASTILSMGE